MSPKIILIRHAQAMHNPELTEKGLAQCDTLAEDLRAKYSFPPDETLIVVSPLVRTLQSFQRGLGWLAEAGAPVQLRAEWQETTANPCDVGTAPSTLSKAWPHLDFTQLDPVYPAKEGLYGASEESLLERARYARKWLFQRPEKFVVVMTHSGFLRRVVPKGPKYANVEYRAYEFAEEGAGTIEGERQYALIEFHGKQFEMVEVQESQPAGTDEQQLLERGADDIHG